MKPCLSITSCKLSAQPGASGLRPAIPATLLPMLPYQIASTDANCSKNPWFGISGLLWRHYCEQVSIFCLSQPFFRVDFLQTTLYITEPSAFKNNVLYFRRDDWDVLCAPHIERLTSVTFSELEEVMSHPVLQQRILVLYRHSNAKPKRCYVNAH